MQRLSPILVLLVILMFPVDRALAQTDVGTYITTADVGATEAEGAERLRDGRTISDLMIRHVDVGDEQLGVAIVQRRKPPTGASQRGIGHVKQDETYQPHPGNLGLIGP